MSASHPLYRRLAAAALGGAALLALAGPLAPGEAAAACAGTVTADVVALDQPFEYNRYGASNPGGMIYALKRDVVTLATGEVALRADKRPRPLVLRVNEGDCLQINFTNLLAQPRADAEQPNTRTAGIHVVGLEYAGGPGADDGAFVGKNPNSLVDPGQSTTYKVYAGREGTYLFYSAAATTGGEGDGGSLAMGLFGAINVEPAGAEWYRSQVTAEDLRLATEKDALGRPITLPTGHPKLDYGAVYPAGHRFAGLPILSMRRGGEIVHGDLNAIITGPGRGNFAAGTYPENPVLEPNAKTAQALGAKDGRTREEPFRENTVIFHDEIFAVQAFPEFDDPVLGHTLHGVRDGFAINYGTAGVGAEVLANRKKVGHVAECNECKYEEFFLSSWAVGDPSMVVDVPAGVQNPTDPLDRATVAYYPDDPSNVFHSYLGDHVKFRNLHAGPAEHHIFHLHAHQWLLTPDSRDSSYLDSQALGPGSAYTYEIAYNGAGNRNQTVGDAIYHCHFYPHFAQGMWALWRNHDVFEAGTELERDPVDGELRPAPGSRAYPDAELMTPDGLRMTGSPIPAVVPVPTLAMAPMPAKVAIDPQTGGADQADLAAAVAADKNPGYPFFVPGEVGHRPPQPPLDFAADGSGALMDGGLPRHMVVGGTAHGEASRLSFDKVNDTLEIVELPDAGEPIEQVAMGFHAARAHPSVTPEGKELAFVTNGLDPVEGAPFADPCVDDQGNPTGNPRLYKAAGLQLDIVYNKAGWHFPQARMLALWDDVAALKGRQKPPEPLFFRANSGDCITLWHANLLPHVYEQDDFQVQTPTDTLGQHIHLVKFDVMASDGGGNGWNYEDGTFAPGEVKERIAAINRVDANKNNLLQGTAWPLQAKAHPLGTGVQTTIQRWYVDPVTNGYGGAGEDRTLRTVYTHDHFGPSTHQQAGLYAGLVIEPVGSTWRHNETGQVLGGRHDGGPTSWQAVIDDGAASYREFLLEFSDFALAYEKGGGGTADAPRPDPAKAVNPPGRVATGLPDFFARPNPCPGGAAPPCPEAISADDPGTFTVNYRNEPVALRVYDPATKGQAAPTSASPVRGDLAFAFRSDVERAIPQLNTTLGDAPYPALTKGVQPGDPFTPLLRAYQGDDLQIRVLVGSQEEGHNFTVQGVKWLHEPDRPDSGWRNTQMTGISEHFEFEVPLVPVENAKQGPQPFIDQLWTVDASADSYWNGAWGLLRAYDKTQGDLQALPNNPPAGGGTMQGKIANKSAFAGACPTTAPVRRYQVSAISASGFLPDGRIVYNARTGAFGGNPGPLNDPTALLYVRDTDLDFPKKGSPTLKPGVPIEPLVLRANAGDCVEVTLTNRFRAPVEKDGYSALPMMVEGFNANDLKPSLHAGMGAQLLARDMSRHAGWNVGLNNASNQTVSPGGVVTYRWYAGDLDIRPDGKLVATPVEFGAVNLAAADPIKQNGKGLIGALIVEPEGATWAEDATTRAAATVTKADGGKFREFVLLFQDDVNLRDKDGRPIPPVGGDPEDAEDSGNKAMNYRTEPLWFRQGFAPGADLEATRDEDFTAVLSNAKVGGDPQTPVFTAKPGQEVRFRVLQPGGHPRNHVFALHGHSWQRQPYKAGAVASQAIGDSPLSEWTGAQEGHGPANHFDVVLNGGAGPAGDYLYRDQTSTMFDAGIWGLLRVE